MKKLFEKSEITFAIIWIIIYVVGIGNLQSKRERPCFQTWDESLNLYCRFVAFVSSFVYNKTNER